MIKGPRGISVAMPIVLLLQRCSRIAVVGLSTDARAPENLEAGKLLSFGLEVYPIHPTAPSLLDLRCYPDVLGVPFPLDLVQVFPNQSIDLQAVAQQAIEKSVKVFWYEGDELPSPVVESLGIAHVHVVIGHSLATEYLALEE